VHHHLGLNETRVGDDYGELLGRGVEHRADDGVVQVHGPVLAAHIAAVVRGGLAGVFDFDPYALEITGQHNVTAGTALSDDVRELSWAKGLGDERIAVTNFQGELWVITADGSSPPDLILSDTSGLWASAPSWSPDGGQIVFSDYREAIYVIDAYGLFPPEPLARRKGSTRGLYLPSWRP